jgi:predicted transcriptional regulator
MWHNRCVTSNRSPQPTEGAFARLVEREQTRLLIGDVAERLGVSVPAVRKMVETGKLSTTVVGVRRPQHTFDQHEVQDLAFRRAKRRGHSMRELVARAAGHSQ